MALLANPQDILTTPYGYSGQMSPETAVAEQQLNRRRLIANMMLQNGLTKPQGRIAGRFYVAPNPLEHVANLGQVAAGALLTKNIDDKSKDLMTADRQSVIDAIQAYRNKQQLSAAPGGAGDSPPSPSVQAPPMSPASTQQPYSGEVGAMAQPDMAPPVANPEAFRGIAPGQPDKFTGVSNFQARPDTLGSGIQPGGLDPRTITPADMSQFAPHPEEANQAQATPAQQMPSPAPAPMPTPAPAPRKETFDDLAELMTHQHPDVRRYAMLRAEMLLKQQEHERNQANLDRAYGLDERKLKASQENTTALREDTNAYRTAALGQQGDLARATQAIAQQNADTAQARAAQAERQAADRLRLDRAELGIKQQQLAQGKTPPGYRSTGDGGLEAIPGGPADTKLQGVFNQDTAMLQNSNAGLDRMASTANQLLNHPGLAGIVGVRGKIPDVPGSDAADARALINTLKSQVGFGVLQEMRNNSKTGGALGSVSDAEGKRLENNLAALDTTQGLEQFKRQLKEGIIDYTTGAKDRMRDAFNMKHKTGQAPSPSSFSLPTNHPPTNSKGWKIMQDANGNKAYVSPDGSQFEEVH